MAQLNLKSCHDDTTNLREGEKLGIYHLHRLQGALNCRIGVITLASEYKDLLGLSFADCNAFEVESAVKPDLDRIDIANGGKSGTNLPVKFSER